jgi:hypothetical protein
MIRGDIDILLEAEPIKKGGKELPSSKGLLASAIKELGPGFVDYIGADALYVDKGWINMCLEAGIYPVIRTYDA